MTPAASSNSPAWDTARWEAGRDDGPFHNEADRILMQRALIEVTVAVDTPEQRSFFDLRRSDPIAAGANRAGFRC